MKPKRYAILIGDITILTTDSKEEAYEHMRWIKTKRPKAPVEIQTLTWNG